jgi:acyl-CoA dehydrogenase
MDIDIPEEARLLRDSLRRFVREVLHPVEAEIEETDQIPPHIIEELRKQGLFGLAIPQEYGGLGLSLLAQCVVFEELAKASLCFRSRVGTNNGIGSLGILFDGTEEQKRKYLPKLASGEWTGAFALTEPNAGSDAAAIECTAAHQGDGFILNGRKQWITNADLAHVFTVMAVTDKAKRARGGITAFLVHRDTPGLTITKPHKTMGFRGSHVCDLVFEEARVPAGNVLGKVGDGFKVAMKVLDRGRLTMGSVCVGAAQRLLELSIAHAKKRAQFGKPIAEQQAIQFMLADTATELYACRSMLHDAARRMDRGERLTKEVAMVKLHCSEMVGRAADRAVQIHGGMGYMRESPVERYYRDVRLIRIYEGTSEIQRLIIARELLKEY